MDFGFFFQMIHACVIQLENRFVLEFGRNQKDSHRKAMPKIYKSDLVVLMQVSLFGMCTWHWDKLKMDFMEF